MYRDDKIRAAQAARNWTDERLAKESGLGRTTVLMITNGNAEDPKLSSLSAIAKALDLTLQDIFEPETVKEVNAA